MNEGGYRQIKPAAGGHVQRDAHVARVGLPRLRWVIDRRINRLRVFVVERAAAMSVAGGALLVGSVGGVGRVRPGVNQRCEAHRQQADRRRREPQQTGVGSCAMGHEQSLGTQMQTSCKKKLTPARPWLSRVRARRAAWRRRSPCPCSARAATCPAARDAPAPARPTARGCSRSACGAGS